MRNKLSACPEFRPVLRLVVLSTIVVLSGCVPETLYEPVTSNSFGPPRDPSRVTVYMKGYEPNKAYETMGMLVVSPSSGKSSCAAGSWKANFSPEECFAEMQKQAAAKGGDAVIRVQYISSTSDVSEFGASGRDGSFGAYGYSGPVTIGMYAGLVVRWKD